MFRGWGREREYLREYRHGWTWPSLLVSSKLAPVRENGPKLYWGLGTMRCRTVQVDSLPSQSRALSRLDDPYISCRPYLIHSFPSEQALGLIAPSPPF